MNVRELRRDQLEELREVYFWTVENEYTFPHEIPDSVIFKYYDGICFVDDDFFSSFVASQPLTLPF